MKLLVTPTFQRTVKKLRPNQKEELDRALRKVMSDPNIGETKAGDLAGIKVYKFQMGKLLTLLAYRILDESKLKVLMVGPHENFYRSLKRLDS